jgi:hypothetical protein
MNAMNGKFLLSDKNFILFYIFFIKNTKLGFTFVSHQDNFSNKKKKRPQN